MKREISVEWLTEFNEARINDLELRESSTKLILESDDDGVIWFVFKTGFGTEFRRSICPDYIVKLSRFFYDAADFIKVDS